VFISFEESIPDLAKNVASLGFDLDRLVADKKLFVDHVSITRSELGETGESWTPWKRSSANCLARASCAPKSAAFSTGLSIRD
jgi:KaiC/GvpD/RAD55 family RecA-like ATPase